MDQGIPKKERKLHILGGGPAGLSVAYFAKQKGIDFELLEGGDQLGGNCRTLQLGDCLFDTGAHRFHDKNPEVTTIIKNLLGDDLLRVSAPSQIFHQKQFFRFPLTFTDLVKKLDWQSSLKVSIENILSRLKLRQDTITNFAELAHRNYGPTLSAKFLLNYSRKLWGLDTHLLSPTISGGRLRGLDLKHFIRESILGQVETPTHIDGDFFYPKYGFGMICDKLVELIGKSKIHTTCRITNLMHSNGRIDHFIVNGNQKIPVSQIISTLPLHLTIEMLEPKPPSKLLRVARSIRFRHLVLVVFCLNRNSFSDNASIYFPDPQIPFTRLYEPKNRSQYMSPPDQTAIVIELPCDKDDEIWQKPDISLQQQVFQALQEITLIGQDEILQCQVIKLPFAYPVMTANFETKVEKLLKYCQRFENLYLIGRNALFRYLHLHNLFELGQLSVKQLMKDFHCQSR